MMSYLLDKLLADNDGNNLSKLAPLLIFFVIWLVGAIAKAAQKGKKGAEAESVEGGKKHESGFDNLARKIRERYATAKEQATKNRETQQGGNEQFMPPARAPQPKPPMFEVTRAAGQPQIKKPVAYPVQSTSEHEGPTLRVVKGLQQTNVGAHLTVEKPTLQKVEPDLQRVDALTSENAKASGEVEIHQQHPYLAELAEQYATQDGFRKAILNYEILGPPLALRE